MVLHLWLNNFAKSISSRSGFNEFADIGVACGIFLTLLLKALDVLLPLQLVSDCRSSLLLSNHCRLLLWIIELDLNLIHLVHRGVCGRRPIGSHKVCRLLLNLLLLSLIQHGLGLDKVMVLVHSVHAQGVFLVLTQVHFNARLRATG